MAFVLRLVIPLGSLIHTEYVECMVKRNKGLIGLELVFSEESSLRDEARLSDFERVRNLLSFQKKWEVISSAILEMDFSDLNRIISCEVMNYVGETITVGVEAEDFAIIV